MRECLLHLAQILAEAVQFAQPLLNTESLVQRKRLNAESGTPLLAKQTGGGASLDQIRGQNRMNLVLQPRALPHQL
ncbi:hypothetical protein WL26_23930 [Burkholderia cepacia]|nr:hypothetical protein WL26_23930 [Burkholderia cepacia]